MTATLSPVTLPASAADTDVVRALREVLARRVADADAAYTRALEDLDELPTAGARLTEAEGALRAFDRAARAL